MARDELLGLGRDVADVLRLEGGVDGLAAAEELVEAEGEGWEARLRVLDLVAGEEVLLDRFEAAIVGKAGDLSELLGDAVRAGNRLGLGADEPAGARLLGEAERRLEPAGERLGDEGLVPIEQVLICV